MKRTISHQGIYYLSLIAAQMMVGINIAGSKFLLPQLPAIYLLFFRFMASAVLLTLFQFFISQKNQLETQALKDLNKKDWFYILAQGLCAGILFNLLLLLGLHFTSASMAGVITSALPAMISLLSIIILRERLELSSSLCIFFSILGLLIINAHNIESSNINGVIGDCIILISLIPEALYYILVKKHHVRLPLFKLSALINGINLPISFLLVCITHSFPSFNFSIKNTLILVLVGISSGLFYVFWGFGAKKINGATTGLFTALMPISTLFISWIFLGESINFTQYVGMAFVIMAILVNAFRQKDRRLNQAKI